MSATSHSYSQCFFLVCQNVLNYTTFGITMQRLLVFFIKSLYVNFRADFNISFILAPYNVSKGRLVLHPVYRPENGSGILVSRIKWFEIVASPVLLANLQILKSPTYDPKRPSENEAPLGFFLAIQAKAQYSGQ